LYREPNQPTPYAVGLLAGAPQRNPDTWENTVLNPENEQDLTTNAVSFDLEVLGEVPVSPPPPADLDKREDGSPRGCVGRCDSSLDSRSTFHCADAFVSEAGFGVGF